MNQDYYVYILFRETGVPFYVGKGRRNRWNHHERIAKISDTHKDRTIRKILSKRSNIPKIKIAEDLTNEEASKLEIFFIHTIGREPDGPLINKTRGGDGCVEPSDDVRIRIGAANKGRILSEETRKKMSASKQGFQISDEARAIGAAKRVGQKRTPETKAKMRAAKLGRKLSEKHKDKIRQSQIGKPQKYIITDEIKEKMRAAKLGKKHSLEHRKKISDANLGRKFSPEHRANLSASRLGMKFTPEHCANISAAQQGKKRSYKPVLQGSV